MTAYRNLIFLSQLKSYLGENVDYTTNDDTYKLSIALTSDLFKDILSRSLFRQEYTEYYDSINTKDSVYSFYLKNWPVDDSSDFTVSINRYDNEFEELDPSTYTVDYENGVVTLKTPLYNARKNIRVVYTAGYADSVDLGVVENLSDPTQERALGLNIPSTLYKAALQQAALYAATMQASLCSDNKKNAFSTRSVRESFGLSPSAMFLLSSYKRQIIRMV